MIKKSVLVLGLIIFLFEGHVLRSKHLENSNLYLIESNAPWGDYGESLCHGYFYQPKLESNDCYYRTGFSIPDLSPTNEYCVVSDQLRIAMEKKFHHDLKFEKVSNAKFLKVDWTSWNRLEDPQLYPSDYSPEGYYDEFEYFTPEESKQWVLWKIIGRKTQGLIVRENEDVDYDSDDAELNIYEFAGDLGSNLHFAIDASSPNHLIVDAVGKKWLKDNCHNSFIDFKQIKRLNR